MKKSLSIFIFLTVFNRIVSAAGPDDAYLRNWPQWRGPLATGEAPHGNPPVEWSETKNIRWKIPIPGKGLASPVVWEDRIFILTAVDTGVNAGSKKEEDASENWMRAVSTNNIHRFMILCIERSSGEVVWKKILREEVPFARTHGDGTWASNSPVTDGEHVFAYFGSYGLYCLDRDGRLVWEKDLGDMETRNSFGEGSSPTLYGSTLIVNWDHEGDSFIVAMDKNTGDVIWEKSRNERTSWSTPIFVEVDRKPQIIINATDRTRGYDLETGEVLWEIGGMTVNVIPSPVYADGIVYVTSGFRGASLQAIRLDKARGNIKGTDAVLWTHDASTPYTPSPLLYENKLYFLKVNKGELSCFDAKTGQPHYESKKLDDIKSVYASPSAAAGRVYIVGRDGVAVVLNHGPSLDILAVNSLEDGFDASPVIVGDELFLRGRKSLYCIAEE